MVVEEKEQILLGRKHFRPFEFWVEVRIQRSLSALIPAWHLAKLPPTSQLKCWPTSDKPSNNYWLQKVRASDWDDRKRLSFWTLTWFSLTSSQTLFLFFRLLMVLNSLRWVVMTVVLPWTSCWPVQAIHKQFLTFLDTVDQWIRKNRATHFHFRK